MYVHVYCQSPDVCTHVVHMIWFAIKLKHWLGSDLDLNPVSDSTRLKQIHVHTRCTLVNFRLHAHVRSTTQGSKNQLCSIWIRNLIWAAPPSSRSVTMKLATHKDCVGWCWFKMWAGASGFIPALLFRAGASPEFRDHWLADSLSGRH